MARSSRRPAAMTASPDQSTDTSARTSAPTGTDTDRWLRERTPTPSVRAPTTTSRRASPSGMRVGEVQVSVVPARAQPGGGSGRPGCRRRDGTRRRAVQRPGERGCPGTQSDDHRTRRDDRCAAESRCCHRHVPAPPSVVRRYCLSGRAAPPGAPSDRRRRIHLLASMTTGSSERETDAGQPLRAGERRRSAGPAAGGRELGRQEHDQRDRDERDGQRLEDRRR